MTFTPEQRLAFDALRAVLRKRDEAEAAERRYRAARAALPEGERDALDAHVHALSDAAAKVPA